MAELYGLHLPDLPDGVIVTDAVVILKLFDSTNSHLSIVTTEGINEFEQIGLLNVALLLVENGLVENFEENGED